MKYNSLPKKKDNLIEALSLILDVYENNPLMIDKCIISKEDELVRFLFLLIGADSIELIKDEPDIGYVISMTSLVVSVKY